MKLYNYAIILPEVIVMGIYEFGDKSSNIVLIQPVDEQQLDVMSFEVGEIKRLSGERL